MTREIVANLRYKKGVESEGFTPEKLEAAIERGYKKQAREDKFTTKKTFAPSSIGGYQGICARYWYQAFNGADFIDKSDSRGIASMANGTAAHERIEQVLEDAEVLVAKEIEMQMADPPIRGYMDVIVEIDGEKVVGEIKTTLAEGMAWRVNTMKPSAQHMYQILVYMKSQGMKKGFMLYENKNDQTVLIIPVYLTAANKKFLEDGLNWLRTVYANWEAGEGTNSHIPQRMPTRKNKTCKSCPLFELCWPEDEEALKNVPKSDVIIPPMDVGKVP